MRRLGRPWRTTLLIAACAGLAPAAEPLARYFPKKDLVAYVEFDGIDAHAEAWKKTAFARMLGETPAGSMLEKVSSQLLEGLLPTPLEDFATPKDIAEIVSRTARSGFAFAINRKAGDPSAKPTCVGLVLRGAGRGPLLTTVQKILIGVGLPPGSLTQLDRPGDRKLTLIGPPEGPSLAWWIEKDDLVISILDARHADAMIAALDGKVPNAIDHPSRLELTAKENGFEPIGLAFLDTAALPEMPPEAAMFGLDGIKRLDVRWGYQGEALVSVSRILAPSPRRGVLAMFDQPTFDARSLPPLPGGVGTFTVFSLDPGKVYDQVAAIAKLADPKSADLLAEAEGSFREATGRRLREDVLARVGPRAVLADVPTQVFVSSDRMSGFVQGLARVPRLSVLIELHDRAGFLKDLEAVATWANAQFPLPKDAKVKDGRPEAPLFRRLKNVEAGYEVALSPTYWPLPAGYRPSIVVGEKYMALGTSPDVARKALRREGELGDSLNRAIASLPTDLTILSVSDTRNSALPEVLANVPSLIQWWGFMIQGAEGASPFGSVSISSSPAIQIPSGVTVSVPVPPAAVALAPGQIITALPPPTAVVPAPNVLPPPLFSPAPSAMPAPAVAPPPSVPLTPIASLPPPTAAAPAPAVAPAPSVAPAPAVAPAPIAGPAPNSVPAPAVAPAPVSEVVATAVTPATGNSLMAAIPAIKFRLRLDPEEIPTPEEIRPYLFAATYAMSVDSKGFRITTRESFPSLNPISLAPLAVAGALPLFQQWRDDAEKERLSANLKQLGLALIAYQDKNGHFPPPATLGKYGKPLLSWRVELLPFLGQKDLYDEFHRDEPWDSTHNRTLVERMPGVFAHPDGHDGPGLTPYRGLIGKSAFFDPEVKDGLAIASITDGTSNTLALVEAKEAVPWTKPGTEIPVVSPAPANTRTTALLALLGGRKPGGFQALLVDGSVRFLRDSVNINVLHSITTRNGGEVVSSDSF